MTDGASSSEGATTPESGFDTEQELVSRLRVIESQPLAARADAYAALHEQLSARLESGPHA